MRVSRRSDFVSETKLNRIEPPPLLPFGGVFLLILLLAQYFFKTGNEWGLFGKNLHAPLGRREENNMHEKTTTNMKPNVPSLNGLIRWWYMGGA